LRKLLPKRRKALQSIKEHEHFVRKVCKVYRDLLPEEACDKLRNWSLKLRQLRKSPDTTVEDASNAIQETDSVCEKYIPEKLRRRSMISEYMEIGVVALGIAFAVRGFALQPFKIPTGSMEPTLCGIHFVEKQNLTPPNMFEKAFGFLHYSRRYVNVTIKEPGQLESIKPGSSFPFMKYVDVTIGGVTYRLPGSLRVVKEYLPAKVDAFFEDIAEYRKQHLESGYNGSAADPPYFNKGEVLARGYLIAGDHLFVDRFSWNFTEPERGDITVFVTKGLTTSDGESLNGRYYIKRLVGLPGDELKIKNRKLYLRKPGEKNFKLVDEDIDPAFTRIYSRKNGYSGYTHHSKAAYLNTAQDVYEVPEDHYFMLGDNSPHSLDSRFWGVVPRENLVGQAALVWWPFSERWGAADHRYH